MSIERRSNIGIISKFGLELDFMGKYKHIGKEGEENRRNKEF